MAAVHAAVAAAAAWPPATTTIAAAALGRLAQRSEGVQFGVDDVARAAEFALDVAPHVLRDGAAEVVRQQQRVLDAAQVLLVVDATRPVELRLDDRVAARRAYDLLVEIKSAR